MDSRRTFKNWLRGTRPCLQHGLRDLQASQGISHHAFQSQIKNAFALGAYRQERVGGTPFPKDPTRNWASQGLPLQCRASR